MWKLKEGEVERRRVRLGFSIQRLADLADLDRKTIERIESGERQRVTGDTVSALAEALECKPIDIATSEEAVQLDGPGTGPPIRSAASSIVATGPDTKQAQREARMGIARPYLVMGDTQIPIMSYTRKKQVEMTYGVMAGDTFAACGKIRHYDPMPADVAAFLRADLGAGAGYFIVQREIKGLGPQGGSEYIKTVVFVPSGEHSAKLMAFHEQFTEVTVLMRLVVREPQPANGWSGFPTYDAETPIRPWAFVSQWVTRRGDLPECDTEPVRPK